VASIIWEHNFKTQEKLMFYLFKYKNTSNF